MVRVRAGLGSDSRESWLVQSHLVLVPLSTSARAARTPPAGATQLKLATYVGVVPPSDSESGPFERAFSTGIQLMVLHMVVLEFMW